MKNCLSSVFFSNFSLDLDQEIPKEDTIPVNRVIPYSKTYCVGDYAVRDSRFVTTFRQNMDTIGTIVVESAPT